MAFDNLIFFCVCVELLGVASKPGELFGSAHEGQGHRDRDQLLLPEADSRLERVMPIKLHKNSLSPPVIPTGFV